MGMKLMILIKNKLMIANLILYETYDSFTFTVFQKTLYVIGKLCCDMK